MRKLLIGGQALRELGSDRYTDDIDFLVCDISSNETFTHNTDGDLINANGHKFFMEVWNMESGNTTTIASVDALCELKAFAFVQHCQNFNFAKADACEYDLKFLFRLGANLPEIVKKYISLGEYSEITKLSR